MDLNHSAGIENSTEAPTMSCHSWDTYKIPSLSPTLDDATSKPLSLFNFTSEIPGFTGYGYLNSKIYNNISFVKAI